ncbi:MAG TPA: tannase/feruloyl esterase family alpha/beta hydrolase [Caulobacteraceae bacterium]
MKLLLTAVLAASSSLAGVSLAHAQDGTADACRALTALASPTLRVETAELTPAGPMKAAFGPPGAPAIMLPEHCRVRGTLDPRTGVGGKSYGIGFELRLPTKWNGRFLFQGGGGLDGAVNPAIGGAGAGEPALARGFAVVTTDAGHQGPDAGFGDDQQARLDYAYQALGKVTAEAKAIIARFYGQGPRRSYFMGCSNGGRQGMMAAERYPLDFDGIIAGDPGFRLSRAAVGELWDTVQLAKIAPHDAQGRPIVSKALTPDDLKLLSKATLDACDGLDGLKDGLINDVRACRFSPRVLTCKAGATNGCLSPAKVSTIERIFGGAHDSKGRPIYASWPYDAGVGDMGWRIWKMGSAPTGAANGINQTMGLDALRRYFATPQDPAIGAAAFDFDKAAELTAETGTINDPTSTFMSSFVQHGGRLLLYQGLSDPVFSANDIIGWYDQLAKDAGPPQDWARLFLVPGMNHCQGGPATDRFDALAALQAWVEDGKAPERLVATGAAFPGQSRPLCPYPKFAHYKGGDAALADSFACTP